jgi:DNA adenine methylase
MSSPIIPWMGGKRRLADRLIPLFPPHECYVEVFAGGAALYFMRPQAAPVEVLNDINGDLVTLYRVVQRVRAPVQMGAQLAPGVRVAEDDPPRNPH